MDQESAEVLARYRSEGREHEVVLVRIPDGEGRTAHTVLCDRAGDRLETIERLSGVDLERSDEVARAIAEDYIGQVERWLRGEREDHPLPRQRAAAEGVVEVEDGELAEAELLELMGADDDGYDRAA